MKYFYEYKIKNGAKVGGHNLEKIDIYKNTIVLIGVDYAQTQYGEDEQNWHQTLNPNEIEYIKIEPMEEENMNKEELINFINSIEFELVTNLELTYCKKMPKSSPYDTEEDRYDMERKTITFNKDFENLLNERTNWIDRRIDDLYKGIQQIEERINKNEK